MKRFSWLTIILVWFLFLLPLCAKAHQKQGVSVTYGHLSIEGLRDEMIHVASQIQELEVRASDIESSVRELEGQVQEKQDLLDSQQEHMASTLSALLHLSQISQLVTLFNEKDLNKLVRVGILLKAVVPQLAHKSRTLRQQLSELRKLQLNVTYQKQSLVPVLAEVNQKQAALSALFEAKSRMFAGRPQVEFGKKVRDSSSVKELLTHVYQDKKLANVLRQQVKELKLQPPVQGKLLTTFDKEKQFSNFGHGVVMETRSNAQVTAPASGTVVFAGPFRGYGHILIMSSGPHYHILLGGMKMITVGVGQSVWAGEPVGRMANGGNQPRLYLELRKNTQTIDPTPWVIKWNQ